MKFPFPTVAETRLILAVTVAVLIGLVVLFPAEFVDGARQSTEAAETVLSVLLRVPAEVLEVGAGWFA